jgi:sugar (pentulose or hexulose) kinase
MSERPVLAKRMTLYTLLIDIGTTNVKAGMGIAGQGVADHIRRNRMPDFIHPERKEMNPDKVLELVKTFISEYVEEFGEPIRILVSGQMASWILTSETGEYLTNIISWQTATIGSIPLYKDSYGHYFDSQKETLEGNGNENTVGVPWRGLPEALLKLRSHNQQIYFHSLCSWVVWELCNRESHLIHFTDAAATGMVSLSECSWMGNFRNLGVNVELPEITHEILEAGKLAGSRIPIYVGLADQQVSLYGVGLSQGEFAINAGTGGQVSCIKPITQDTLCKTRPYFHGQFLQTYTHIPSGRFLEQILKRAQDYNSHKYDWNWLWAKGNFDDFEKNSSNSLDWNFETFLNEIDFCGDNFETITDQLVVQLINGFIMQLRGLGFNKGDSIILAGGVATNLIILREFLAAKYYARIRSADDQDSTILGLSRISQSL